MTPAELTKAQRVIEFAQFCAACVVVLDVPLRDAALAYIAKAGEYNEPPGIDLAEWMIGSVYARPIAFDLADYERDCRRLIDPHLDAATPIPVIERHLLKLVHRQPRALQQALWLLPGNPWDYLARDRMRAWRWRNSPRGRRALGR
jgi:hypothetical protein